MRAIRRRMTSARRDLLLLLLLLLQLLRCREGSLRGLQGRRWYLLLLKPHRFLAFFCKSL
jgi:hypothetical protein